MKVDLLLAMNWMKEAWNGVTAETISNCFKKAGFRMEEDLLEETPLQEDESEMQDSEFMDWVAADDCLRVHEDTPDADDADEETEEEDEDQAQEPEKPSFKDLCNATDVIRKYSMFVELIPNAEKICSEIEKSAYDSFHQSLKQSKITDFFTNQ